MRYIKGLDTLRAVAVFFVLTWHLLPRGGFNQFIPSGAFGVNLFFVLSGFLITGILLKAREVQKIDALKTFYLRRSLRIFPVYFLLLFVLIALRYPFTDGSLSYLFTYTNNLRIFFSGEWGELAHTWSLCVEEQFYLLWPFVILFTPEKLLTYAIGSFICIALISDIALRTEIRFDNPSSTFTLTCFDAFGIGGLYAYALQRGKEATWLLNIGFLVGLSLCLYWDFSPAPIPRYQYFFRTAHSLIAIRIIHLVIHAKCGMKRVFENKLLTSIGRVSYGIYLFHVPVAYYVNLLFNIEQPLLLFAVDVSLAVLLAYASFYFFEQPILKIKNRFFYRERPALEFVTSNMSKN